MADEKKELTPDELVKNIHSWGGNSDYKEPDPNLTDEEKLQNSLKDWSKKK